MIKISEIEQIFREIFDEEGGLVKSIETLYESPNSGEDFLKLIISIHGLTIEDVSIIHTKFIFKVDSNKRTLISDSFIYLYDINCVYHKIEFNSIIDIKKKVEDIISSNDFGEDMQILSDFIEAPAMFLNYYMRRNNITEYSIFDVEYQPKFKTTPCDKTTFDFKININNNYNMELSIRKIEAIEEDEIDIYKFQFRFMDEIETVETETIKNMHFFIGDNISKILDRKLKNK
jgi:hypothetical protein